MKENDFVLIGIDGGATKVSGWTIRFDKQGNSFSLGAHNTQVVYKDVDGYSAEFIPVEIPTQLEQQARKDIHITSGELQQGQAIIEACAQVIQSLAEKSGNNVLLVGIGMPGLKTEDKRGIAVLANGPRIVSFSDRLEEILRKRGISLFKKIKHLGSDADYCGLGENFALDGMFKDIQTGYYLGGGTGVADALKIKGELLPFDQAKKWIAKTWEMKSCDGRSMERFTSMGGLQAVYANIAGVDVIELNESGIYPLQIAEKATKGEQNAIKLVQIAVENLSKLIFERIITLYAGSDNQFGFVSTAKPHLSKDHPYLSSLFERIVIGQRLGQLFESEHGFTILRDPIIDKVQKMVDGSEKLDQRAKDHYRDLDRIILSSNLREAPAIGAGIDAYLQFHGSV